MKNKYMRVLRNLVQAKVCRQENQGAACIDDCSFKTSRLLCEFSGTVGKTHIYITDFRNKI